MQFDILTLFPNMFSEVFDCSIIKRALEKKLIKINLVNLRDFTTDKHRTVDDRPFGGGPGMILRIEPIDRALNCLKKKKPTGRVILLTPQGALFKQEIAQKLSRHKKLILICGHYEGIDERVAEELVDESLSIGDYVLTGGELPAMVVVDAVTRLLPGVLSKKEATQNESFQSYPNSCKALGKAASPQLLEAPQYTRPATYKKCKTPKILLSGDHQKISTWRQNKAFEKTRKLRPDLLERI